MILTLLIGAGSVVGGGLLAYRSLAPKIEELTASEGEELEAGNGGGLEEDLPAASADEIDGEELRGWSEEDRYTAMLDLFRGVLSSYFSGAAREDAAVVMTAHMALESGNKQGEAFKSFPKGTNNLLGINARPGDDYVDARDSDGTIHKFRKFPAVNDLVVYYVKLVKNYYPNAWAAAAVGDVPGYASGLKYGKDNRHYYGAKLEDFTAGLRARNKKVLAYA